MAELNRPFLNSGPSDHRLNAFDPQVSISLDAPPSGDYKFRMTKSTVVQTPNASASGWWWYDAYAEVGTAEN